jgi:hypothetical protein
MSFNGIGSPFSVGNITLFVHIEPELLVSLISHLSIRRDDPLEMVTYPAKPLQPSLRFINLPNPILRIAESGLQGIRVRLEPRIELEDTW